MVKALTPTPKPEMVSCKPEMVSCKRQLSPLEEGIIRYVSGFVSHKLLKRFEHYEGDKFAGFVE